MEAEDPLSQLADIHLPAAVTFWPPAPGWWVLVALVLLALALLGRRQLQLLLVRRRLATALRELSFVHAAWKEQQDQDIAGRNAAGLALLYGFNAILKRVALATSTDPLIPRLIGPAWLQFLDSFDGRTDFSTGVGRVLADGTYRPVFDADVDGLHALCRRWITARYLQAVAPLQTAAPVVSEAGT